MRASQYLLATLKKTPKNCETISHQLMLRSGMIRKVSSGIYTWLPTGLRVLRKIENIIRKEMNKIGFIEILMPIIQPSTLWKQSGRWSEYGTELLRFKNRNNQDFIFSPTHEEIVSDLICKEITSHTEFPINVYQIHTKYRDEARPQFGLIRSREFVMKDGYSFHTNQKSLQKTYDNMYDIYHTIFNRIGLNFYVTQADPGKIGGILSHEFQTYFNKKKNNTIVCKIQNKSNNLYLTSNNSILTHIQSNLLNTTMAQINISNINSTFKLLNEFHLPFYKTIKMIIVQASKNKCENNLYNFLGLVIRADHQLSYEKTAIIPEIHFPLSIINENEIQKIIGIQPTLYNFINLSIPIIIDYNVAIMNNFNFASNMHNQSLFNTYWNQNLPFPKIADLHHAQHKKHKSLKNSNILPINNNIEIGHIFQLGEKYSNKIQNNIHKNNKHNYKITMGCYGIGISRMIPAIIEQNYDDSGIIWPEEIAPFKLAIIPINIHRSINVNNIAEKLYNQLLSIGIDVFIDDRVENPGVIFTDIDLIGIPHILIISDRNLYNKEIEYRYRKTGKTKKIKLDSALQFLNKTLINN